MARRNLLRVWLYRGWCWACRIGVDPARSIMPCSVGHGFATPGQAADAARHHATTAHGGQTS